MASDLTAASGVFPAAPATPSESPWPPPPAIPSHQALAIATADAEQHYRGNFGRFRIEITLHADGWHIEHTVYSPPGMRIAGGGPHYVISADTGEILSKKYYQ